MIVTFCPEIKHDPEVDPDVHMEVAVGIPVVCDVILKMEGFSID